MLSIVLLLQVRGRMSADDLACALEVSPRTVCRDMEALSAAGEFAVLDQEPRHVLILDDGGEWDEAVVGPPVQH